MASLNIAKHYALGTLGLTPDLVNSLSIDDIIVLANSATNQLPLTDRANLIQSLSNQILADRAGTERAYAVGRLCQHIADIKRDAGSLCGYAGAVTLYHKSIKHYTEASHFRELPWVLLGLGACYEMQNAFRKATMCYEAGLTIYDRRSVSPVCRGRLVLRLGTVYTKTDNHSLAKGMLLAAVDNAERFGNAQNVDYAAQKLAAYYLRRRRFESAWAICQEILLKSNDDQSLRNVQRSLLEADILLSSGDAHNAEGAIERAKLACQKQGYMHQLKTAYRLERLLEARSQNIFTRGSR